MIYVVWIKAPNDKYGNPQRGFLVQLSEYEKPVFVSEGYTGFDPIDKLKKEKGEKEVLFNQYVPIHVSATEYRRFVKEYSI